MAVETTKKAVQIGKVVVKATVSLIKEIIAAIKSLIGALASLGSVAVIIVVIILALAALCFSVFGIFMSSEKTSSTDIRMNDLVNECNRELANKIEEIKQQHPHDDVVINSNRANWNDVLLIYSVKVSNGYNYQNELLTIDSTRKDIFKKVFWDMHEIKSDVRLTMVDEDMTDKLGTPKKVKKNILYITIESKTIDEMKQFYHFTPLQNNQLDELSQGKYNFLWNSAIYGINMGNSDVVNIALKEVGNIGGQPYWSWYGFDHRVEWCACFVSWVANQGGYIERNIIPKFAVVSDGANWFKAMNQWKEPGYIPKPGDIIFFDWENDGKMNHVGIVEKADNKYVYTIEGNSSNDDCVQKQYSINSKVIFGYGTPAYN